MSRNKILVVGSMNMDLNIYGLPSKPKSGETVLCKRYEYFPGGKASNQAVAVSNLGVGSYIAGCIGEDSNGRTLLGALKEKNVNISFVSVQKKVNTGLCTINIQKNGDYFSCLVPGANEYVDINSIREALYNEDFAAILLQLEIPLGTIYETIKYAKKLKVPVILDAGPPREEIDISKLQGCYIVSPNETETKSLCGIEVIDEKTAYQASEILHEQFKCEYVVLKLGSIGSYLYDGKSGKLFPSYKVNAIDTTGAGDTFTAALATRVIKGDKLDDSIRFATAAAALCVTNRGAIPSIPTEIQVENFMSSDDIRKES